jgi:hypothetical protein
MGCFDALSTVIRDPLNPPNPLKPFESINSTGEDLDGDGKPDAPVPVDPGVAMTNYIKSVTDPALQNLILDRESEFRPKYNALNLQEMQRYLSGFDGNAGLLDQLKYSTLKTGEYQAEANSAQRLADIKDVEALGSRAADAFSAANPQMAKALSNASALSDSGNPYKRFFAAVENPYNNVKNGVNPLNNSLLGPAPIAASQGYNAAISAGANNVQAQAYNAPQMGASPIAATQGYNAAISAGANNVEGRGYNAAMMGGPGNIDGQSYEAAMLGLAPQAMSVNSNAQGYNAAMLGAAPMVGSNGYAAQGIEAGALGKQLLNQAMAAGGLGATGKILDTRAAELAASTGKMTPEETRAMEQQLRSSYGARGTLDSSASVSAEALGRLSNERGKMQQDLGMASMLNQGTQAELGANRGFQQNIEGMDMARRSENANIANQASQFKANASNQAAFANQGMLAQYGLANQASQNQANQFGANAYNQNSQFNAANQTAAKFANQQMAGQYGLADQAARNQAGMYAADSRMQAAGQNQQMQMQAALANQQSQNQAGQFGASAYNNAALANQGMQMQNAMANQQSINQAGQFGAGAWNQASLANQQMQGQYGMAAAEFQNAANQYGAEAKNRTNFANQQMQMQNAMANQQSINQAGQFGADAWNRESLANQQYAAQYGLANQSAQNQVGMFNQEMQMATQESNRAFMNQQQQQYIANQGLLGQYQAGQLGADRAYALQLAQMYGSQASDPFQAILGRSSQAVNLGAGQNQSASGLLGSLQGPQLFDPNAGVNLALQNSANLANYNASIYGSQAAADGAASAGQSAMMGRLGGAAIGGVLAIF